MNHPLRWTVVAACIALMTVSTAQGEVVAAPVTSRIVSTSGVPHRDVADYRKSPAWKTGFPKGANTAWRTYMTETVAQITASNPDTVLHQGDQVEGRWYGDDQPAVFGSRGTWKQKTQMVHNAANTIYPWVKSFWSGHDVIWAMGDHEIGDIGSRGFIPPADFRYRAHWHWNDAWKRHFGYIRKNNRRGNVGIITLDPFTKMSDGVHARISKKDRDYIRAKVDSLRAAGAEWIIVQCEIPAIGPNRSHHAGTSGLLLDNGDQVWNLMQELGVDLYLTAEFHDDTTYTASGRAPMHIVHGGFVPRASWLQIDVHGGETLELSLWESVGTNEGSGTIWAPTKHRANNRPVVGAPARTGQATIHADGSVTGRTGKLTEGM